MLEEAKEITDNYDDIQDLYLNYKGKIIIEQYSAIPFSKEFNKLSEEDKIANLLEYDSLLELSSDERRAEGEEKRLEYYYRIQDLFEIIYGTEYLNKLIRDNLVKDWCRETTGYYFYEENIIVYTGNNYNLIRDLNNNIEIISYYYEEKKIMEIFILLRIIPIHV